MQVSTMRNVDYYAGVPLCALVSAILKLVGLFVPGSKNAQKHPVRKALFIELSEMGSTILADPAMRKLNAEAGTSLFFLIFERNKGSLLLTDCVPEENIFTIRESSIFLLAWDTLRFLIWTRRKDIDTVVDLELFSRFTALLTGLAGATHKVGFYGFHNEGLYRGDMLTHKVNYNPHQHIAKNFIALINALLSPEPQLPFSKSRVSDEEIIVQKVQVKKEAMKDIQERIVTIAPSYIPEKHRLVLINPNASDMLPQRRWMAERYASLVAQILDDNKDVFILITGAPSEKQRAEKLVQAVNDDRCISFAGQVKLSELPALYELSVLMVSNDSGPCHFATLTEMPVVGLFGPETPKLYGPLGTSSVAYAGLACSPCVSAANHRKTNCTDNQCMKAISVGQVYDLVRPYLDAR